MKIKTKELSHIWRCKKCNCRYKMIGGVMEAPKQCECGCTEFVATTKKYNGLFK